MGVAIGLRPHSGWAVAVAVTRAEPEELPRLVLRQRVQLCPDDLPRQVYHAAAEDGRSFQEAAVLVETVVGAVSQRAGLVLGEVVGALTKDGHPPAVVAVIGLPRDLPDLESILASHPLLHSAEGELYRGALAEAAGDLDLPLYVADPRSVQREGALALGIDESDLVEMVKAMGAANGPPWQRDHKDAAIAALTALHGL